LISITGYAARHIAAASIAVTIALFIAPPPGGFQFRLYASEFFRIMQIAAKQNKIQNTNAGLFS
jgi:hypothetical protein